MDRHNKCWTKEECIILRDLAAREVRWGLIAAKLGRTVPAVWNRYKLLRFSEFYTAAMTPDSTMRTYFEGNPVHREK